MKGKVAVLGDADFVMPFSALGVDTFGVGQTKGEIIEKAGEIAEGAYALVIVAEDVAPAAETAFAELHNEPTPCLLVVPFTTESKGFATEALAGVLKLATGIDIMHND